VIRSERPRRVAFIGLRTIGLALAHIAAATASEQGVAATVFSLRPRGHPFDRRIEWTRALQSAVRNTCSDLAAVVDEGPGLSGSSFAAAADALAALLPAARRADDGDLVAAARSLLA